MSEPTGLVAGDLSIAFPVLVEPEYTLDGYGRGVAVNVEELLRLIVCGLRLSPNGIVRLTKTNGSKRI